MPYVFSYKDSTRPNLREFVCVLRGKTCRAKKLTGPGRCSKRCVIGLPYCWMHLLSKKKIKVDESTILTDNGQSAGKGLFAARNRKLDVPLSDNQMGIVFIPGDVICKYDGEVISQATLDERYGRGQNAYPPYAAKILNTPKYEDGACRRGSGSLPNHKSATYTNAALVTDEDEKRVYIQATKTIRHGEEIFVDYGYGNFNTPQIKSSTKSASKNSKIVKTARLIKSVERINERRRQEAAALRAQRNEERLAAASANPRRSRRIAGG